MADKTKKLLRRMVEALKRADQGTHHVLGDGYRALTNVNNSRYWDEKLRARKGVWRDFPYRNFLEYLPVQQAFTLLDIGCVLGDGCLLLQKHFPLASISGADFSPLAISQCGAKAPGMTFHVLDIIKEAPPQTYDFITMASTLEHFNDPYPVVDKCLRYVRQALLIEVPDGGEFENPRLYSKGQHRYLFNRRSFDRYRCTSVKITDLVPETGYRYLIFKLEP